VQKGYFFLIVQQKSRNPFEKQKITAVFTNQKNTFVSPNNNINTNAKKVKT
jgi:hypothetical protein